MDLESFRDGAQVVLDIQDPGSERRVLVLSAAGCIGLNGVNSRGLAVVCNTLMQLKNDSGGLPVNAVIRGVLRSQSLQEAERFLREIHHASGQNYIVGGPDGVASFECSANKVVRFKPVKFDSVVWHTNHPLANDDLTESARATQAAADRESDPPRPQTNSQARLISLKARLRAGTNGSHLELVKTILESKDSPEHPICVSRPHGGAKLGTENFSFSATIMVLSNPPELHVTCGPPDESSYRTLTFRSSPAIQSLTPRVTSALAGIR
jgi:hypothetical protein